MRILFCTTITGTCNATTARLLRFDSSMKLTTTLRGGGTASFSFSFFRRRLRLRSTGSFRGARASPFFTSIGRKRGAAAADNPEPSSPKVTCIGQVRVKSQKKVKQCRRRIGEASFRSVDQSLPQRRRRDQRWVHLPNISVVLRAFGEEFCCLFRCRCCCFHRREREKNGCGTVLGRWLVAVNGGEGERRREIEVVVDGGDEEMTWAGNSRRHVFDDIEVKGDRIEVKGMSLMNEEREATRDGISIPPKNALLLMRCRSDPIKMAAIENRISSDSARYQNSTVEEEDEDEDDDDDDDDDDATTTSSDELFEGEHKIFVAQVLEEIHNVQEKAGGEEKQFNCNQQKIEEIEQQPLVKEEEEEETVKSNKSSSEALLGQQNADNYQDCSIQVEAKSETDQNQDSIVVQQGNDDDTVEKNAVASDKSEADVPGNQEKAAAAPSLPECLLLMMREPKLSMEVSKETWVCATDFIKLLPERPRKAAANKPAGGDHDPAVRRRAAVEKSSRPRVPAPPSKKNNDVQPARSSCSLPAAAVIERKRVNCEPLALTRCKSEPMSTAAAKLMPEAGSSALEVGAAGVGF